MMKSFDEAMEIAVEYFGVHWRVTAIQKGLDGWAFGAMPIEFLNMDVPKPFAGGKYPIYITKEGSIERIPEYISMESFVANRKL